MSGALIEAARKQLGLSRPALAERLGYSTIHLRRIEKGHVKTPKVLSVAVLGLLAHKGIAPAPQLVRAEAALKELKDALSGL